MHLENGLRRLVERRGPPEIVSARRLGVVLLKLGGDASVENDAAFPSEKVLDAFVRGGSHPRRL
jgi:hypothetical protein